jgi:hypothetical protein
MQANGSKMKRHRALPRKTLMFMATFLGLALITLLFAEAYLPKLRGSEAAAIDKTALSVNPNKSAYMMTGWNVSTIGTTEAVGINNGVMFEGSFVFWRVVSSTDFAITAFNVSSHTFKDVWNSNNGVIGGPGDIKVIDNALFASYGYAAPDDFTFNTTIIRSSDLNIWTQYCFSNTVCAESLAQYTGPGPYNDMIEYGGYSGGTWASIRAWNSTSNSEIDVFDGTLTGSDDVCFLTMFNSTCMIGGDSSPSNIIYTNDGQNWTDEYTGSAYVDQYPFVWGWAAYVSNGTAYVAEENSLYNPDAGQIYDGGVITWSGVGTTQAYNYGMTMESISNGLIGGSAGLWTASGDYEGPAVVYQCNSDGTMGSLVWSSGTYDGTVKDLTYDSDSATWYAIAFNTYSSNAIVLKITQQPALTQSSTFVVYSPNVVSVGSAATCTATVSGSNPTGIVTWSTSSSTGSFSPSNCTLSSDNCSTTYIDTSAGNVTITASYSGDPNNGPSSGNIAIRVTSGNP